MKSFRRRLSFSTIAVVAIAIVLELLLHILAAVSPGIRRVLAAPWEFEPQIMVDDRLGYRPNPAYRDHDRNGFRNRRVPDQAEVVVLGDSQTYGPGLKPRQTWPSFLESEIDKPVYSMAFGGYGPVQSLLMWDEAMALKPRFVIEAFYTGNDLYDCFNHVYNMNLLPEYQSEDAELHQRAMDAEKTESVQNRFRQIRGIGVSDEAIAVQLPSESKPWEVPQRGVSLRRIISTHCRLYGLVRRARYAGAGVASSRESATEWEKAVAYAREHDNFCEIFEKGEFRTILTSAYRIIAIDRDDSRIEVGHEIALKILRRMSELAKDNGIRYMVLIIPTKEYVFRALNENPSDAFQRLIASEVEFLQITKQFLDHHGIECLDAADGLQQEFQVGRQPFRVTDDGHLNVAGNRALARIVAEYLSDSP